MLMVPRRNYGLSLLDEMFKDPFFSNWGTPPAPTMRTDIQEKDGKYLIDVDLPGFSKDDIKIELKDGHLVIAAEKNESKDEKDNDGNYIRRERRCGKCSRSFYVGDGITDEDIKASFKDGILFLKIPKIDQKAIEDNRKYITIE